VYLAAAEALRGEIAAAMAVGARILAEHPDFRVDHLFGPTGVAKRPFLDDLERGVRLAGLPIDELEEVTLRR
jgi:hypothetical protein